MNVKNELFNRDWRINNLYRIQTKQSKSVIFTRNEVQTALAISREERRKLNLPIRELILKSRQHGITTDACIESLDDALFKENFTVAIIADKKENVKKIFRKIKYAYDRVPSRIILENGRVWRKPEATTDNANELIFGRNGSRIYVDIKVRGDTVHRLHISEAAFVPDAIERIGSSMEAVPTQGDIIMETTANGAGGYFAELWKDAEEGTSEFEAIFLGWNLDPENRLPVPPGFTRTKEEEALVKRFGLDDGQLQWRRIKQKRLKGIFKQEHPLTAEEAFLFSGRPKFDREKILQWDIREPIRTAMRGELKIFKEKEKNRNYILGIDTAEGKLVEGAETTEAEGGSDYNVIEVIDYETCEVVAEYRSRISYYLFPEIIKRVGKYYNWGFLVPEKNNHGHFVVPKLVEIYPNSKIFTRMREADVKGKKRMKEYGWNTTKKSKPIMVDELEAYIDDQEIIVHSRILQKECLRYIIEDDGSTNAQEGYHDDTVIALALALQGRKFWNPKRIVIRDGDREKIGF
jgi:hypothetical protein